MGRQVHSQGTPGAEEVNSRLAFGVCPKALFDRYGFHFQVECRIPPGTSSSEQKKSQVNPVTQLPWNVPGIIRGT